MAKKQPSQIQPSQQPTQTTKAYVVEKTYPIDTLVLLFTDKIKTVEVSKPYYLPWELRPPIYSLAYFLGVDRRPLYAAEVKIHLEGNHSIIVHHLATKKRIAALKAEYQAKEISEAMRGNREFVIDYDNIGYYDFRVERDYACITIPRGEYAWLSKRDKEDYEVYIYPDRLSAIEVEFFPKRDLGNVEVYSLLKTDYYTEGKISRQRILFTDNPRRDILRFFNSVILACQHIMWQKDGFSVTTPLEVGNEV